MKKAICIILMVLILGCAALAEEMVIGENISIDLNGDGNMETMLLKEEGVEDEESYALYITGADGGMYGYYMPVVYITGMQTQDLNGDGLLEILISGDMYSDDYNTWCLNFTDEEGIREIIFADANRGENNAEYYYNYGYGNLVAVDGEKITLAGSQDVLGTWMASRVFTLKDGCFELEDGGLWQMIHSWGDLGEAEAWEYMSLSPMEDLPVTLEDGSEDAIHAGERFMVTASDKLSIVYFETEDGRRGSFPIEPDVESGWGSLVNGKSEFEVFEYLPYAD